MDDPLQELLLVVDKKLVSDKDRHRDNIVESENSNHYTSTTFELYFRGWIAYDVAHKQGIRHMTVQIIPCQLQPTESSAKVRGYLLDHLK